MRKALRPRSRVEHAQSFLRRNKEAFHYPFYLFRFGFKIHPRQLLCRLPQVNDLPVYLLLGGSGSSGGFYSVFTDNPLLKLVTFSARLFYLTQLCLESCDMLNVCGRRCRVQAQRRLTLVKLLFFFFFLFFTMVNTLIVSSAPVVYKLFSTLLFSLYVLVRCFFFVAVRLVHWVPK